MTRRGVRALSLLVLGGLMLTGMITRDAAAIGVRLSGRITDDQGRPVALADLDFYYSGTRDKIDPTPRGVPPQSDKSDIDGNYGLVVREDYYDIRYQPPAGRDDLATMVVERVEISADTTLNVILPRGVALSGILRDEFGAPVALASVQFTDVVSGQRAPTPSNQTALDGSYRVVVRPGRYDVTYAPPDGTRLVPLTLPGLLLDASRNLDAVVTSGFYLEGLVLDAGGQPLAGVDLDVDRLPENARIRTRGDLSDTAGRFRLLVPAGTFEITYTPPAGTALAAAVQRPIVVGADGVLSPLQLDRGVRVTGQVLDPSGRPLYGARALFVTDADGARIPAPWALSDADGRLDFHLLPNSYRVRLAPPPGVALDTLDVGVVDLRGDTAVDWRWSGGRLWTLSLRLRSIETAAGVAGRVSVWRAPRTGAPLLDQPSDASGDMELRLAAGAYDLVVRGAPGFSPDSLVFAGEILDTDRTLVATFQTGAGGEFPQLTVRAPAPNPFRGRIRLAADAPPGTPVRIDIFDATGRLVRRLPEAPLTESGVEWDGSTDAGGPAAAGHYFIRFELPDGYRQTRRVVRLP